MLIALQLRHQATAVFKFGRRRQTRQLRRHLLLTQLQRLGLFAQGLQVLALALFGALELAHLPYPPTANGNARSTEQQGQDCQAVARTFGRRGGGGFRRFWRRLQVIVGQDSFAHVSILCIGLVANQLSASEGRCRHLLQGCQQRRGAGTATVHYILCPGCPGLRGNARAGHEQRQLCQLRPLLPGLLLQVFKTLPTADHQAVQAFLGNSRR
ncbi:hypothetical protein D3C84_849620 [compost metagenome]